MTLPAIVPIRFARKRSAKSLLSLAVCLSYLLTHVAGVYAAESRFWPERRAAARRIERARAPGGDPLALAALASRPQALSATIPPAARVNAAGPAPASVGPFKEWVSALV